MADVLAELERVIAARMQSHRAGEASAETSYVVKSLSGPEEELLRKVPEEAVEVVLAVTHGGRLAAETADLWFHCLLVLHKAGIPLANVLAELAARLPAENGAKEGAASDIGDN